MGTPFLLVDFTFWYYSRALVDLIAVWFNLIWFVTNFFSIPLLLRTLFSPWKRMTDEGKKRDLEAFFEAVVMNVMSRIFGAFIRFVIICMGLITLTLGIVLLGVALITWLMLPLLLLYSFFYGIILLFP